MDNAAEFVKSWTKLTKDWNARMETELAPQLTAGQLEVLELLQAHEPMKPSDLLPHLETTPAAITTLLDRMERAGLVERNRDEGDRRIVWVTMTELGRSEVERGIAVRSAIVNESLDRISTHNRQLLVYLIGKVSGTREARTPDRKTDADNETAEPAGESAAAESVV
ncbi:MarR family transcriptional regulator [Cohnella sp. CIP 111063]|jgi:DNA-binding MarR family transcriptional regulator|uniref:MarR family winged helix-turn-helix transcriptional regulator n=1 Tax=unclassified Cohnella TaxID=2636738 RepID=UPI000B8C23D1|nr:MULTISPECIES: MarR family transcriptional regulator [unclassified Cohnella]OXS61125.1 MarR family transcriptional regulator [Cohnella sp. CIP 111063]PRX73679.1 DNA-binding MarR family transcriptional regulator [Cohnella sp. SGD-V74]